ncbi:MAG TPA: efflux RND transporter periplasmic adaptor subunit [Planctomycetota bacterium]|nr:efflux RND transporter periplasmic adaptor subunit [Planctomycetota bacterium]
MSDVDLSALRMDDSKRPPRRPLGGRFAALAIALIAVGVVATFVVPLLRPARAVATAAVKIGGSGGAIRQQTAEAAGWIEAEPFPVLARPLVKGVLRSLDVLEGAEVKAGETVIGVLESAELLAARDRAQTLLARTERELERAQTELEVAESLLAQKGEERLLDAETRNRRRAAEEALLAARKAVDEARADREARRADLEGQERLAAAGGTYPVALAKARAAVAAADAALVAREADARAAEAALKEAEERAAIAAELLRDPRGLEGDVERARRALAVSGAEVDRAKTDLAIAERELSWATVKAPVSGVVMKLLAAPGQPVGPEGGTLPAPGQPFATEGGALVAIYDPAHLQARVDVPLASMEGVRAGQEVEVRSEILGSRVTKGVALRIQRETDLLKNTLQVKVKLIDPDPRLRPETLCRARFLAAPGEQTAAAPQVFLVPRGAVRDGAVFVVDPAEGRARRIPVETAGEEGGDVAVKGALSATHRVILDPVKDGERVKEESE